MRADGGGVSTLTRIAGSVQSGDAFRKTHPRVASRLLWKRRGAARTTLLTLALGSWAFSAHALMPLLGATKVVAGDSHSCVLTSSGGVKCWGVNSFGQLGDGTTTKRLNPVDVVGLTSGVAAIAVGANHTCALTSIGGVKCWGYNHDGELGDGTTTDRHLPADVATLASGAVAIATGMLHSCVVTSNGGAKCWGENSNGQLGDGTTTSRLTPVDVFGQTGGVAVIAAGGRRTCSVTSSGGAKCWGANYVGQVGDGSSGNDRLTPVDVSGLTSGVAAITGSLDHTCALTVAGGAKCWGGNYYGELGDGSQVARSTPVDVSGLTSGVVAIAAGGSFNTGQTCAVTSSRGAKCWGNNRSGQLGDGGISDRVTAADVSGLSADVADIAVGGEHTCAVTRGGHVKCWGSDYMGTLGDGGDGQRLTPVEGLGLASGVIAVATGANHTCAVTRNGGAKCWGDNTNGQLGDGTAVNRIAPVDVSGLTSGVAGITAGDFHTCALTTAGGAKCWGYNSAGQLGDGSAGNIRRTPVDVIGLTSGVVGIDAGGRSTCARTGSGGAKCWGDNYDGAVGDGSSQNLRLTPVDVSGLTSGVATITGGNDFTCAVTGSGGAKCWGYNATGAIGDGSSGNDRLSPVDVSGLTNGVAAIGTGGGHTCAVTTSGGVSCWGSNSSGQLGDGTTTQRLTPVSVSGLTTGVSVVTGGYTHTCAVKSGGVKCWGSNINGELGDGTTTNQISPVDVAGLTSGAVSVSALDTHTCAVTTGGAVKCWGVNTYGQLGDGTAGYRTLPVDVLVAAGLPSAIFWRNISGLAYAWLLDGTNLVGAGSPGGAGTDWTIQAIGDFNGDGKADLLWRHTSGVVCIWLLDGATRVGVGCPGSAGADWSIEGAGDFNGDGKADILWRHSSGAVYFWLGEGTSLAGGGSPGGAATDWTI